MPTRFELVFDLTDQHPTPIRLEERYAITLDMCEWADRAGFQAINFGEHHANEYNYLPAPLLMGSAAGARTRRIQLRMILLAPFYNPLRLAEDLAVATLITQGRAFAVLGAGYRPAEFDMFGLRLEDRAAMLDETVDVLRKAWSGQPFRYRGRDIPPMKPLPDPLPRIVLGGSSPLTARMAAKIADGFSPSTKEGLHELYRAEALKLGRPDPGPKPTNDGPGFVYVTEDPDKAWAQVGPSFLRTIGVYDKWFGELGKRSSTIYPALSTIEELKQSPACRVVTPEQCIALAESLGENGRLRIQAFPSGMDPKVAWVSLELLERKVLPHLDVRSDPHMMY